MTPEQQLKGFIAKFTPENQRLIRAVRKWMRQRMPAHQVKLRPIDKRPQQSCERRCNLLHSLAVPTVTGRH